MTRNRKRYEEPAAALPADLHIDLYDYQMPKERKPRQKRRRKWNPTITDDWPEVVPVSVEEVELYELHLGDELDRILGITKPASDDPPSTVNP